MPPAASDHRIVEAKFVATAARLDQLPPPELTEIAFAGRSNVGKSTLLNTLMGRRRLVRTSSTPGCTRAIGFFNARTADDHHVTLVDLPGYGYAQRSHVERRGWATLIEGYLRDRANLRGVVVLVDARRDLESSDLDLLELLQRPTRSQRMPLSARLVATKLDQVPRSQQATRLRALQRQISTPVLGLSALDRNSVQSLWNDLYGAWLRASVAASDSPADSPGPVSPPSD